MKSQRRIDNYRKTFESFMGKPVSFLQWTKYSAEFTNSGLPLNTNSIKLFASFKQHCPRQRLTKDAIQNLNQFQTKYRNKAEWTGCEIFTAVQKTLPTIPDWKLYRACYRTGLSFKATASYSQEQANAIAFYSFIYGAS